MASTDRPDSPLLQGPFPLDGRSIDVHLFDTYAAVFVAGRMHGGQFIARFVGSNGHDPARRLKWLVGRYPVFKFARCTSAHDAFVLECALYHELGPARLDNSSHPVREPDTDWECPLCRIFDR